MASYQYPGVYPFRGDGAARQASAPDAPDVTEMIRQILLSAPGEGANLPEFGCGLRQLVFAPNSEALVATARLVVKQAFDRWLVGHVKLAAVEVLTSGTDDDRITISVTYQLVEETRENELEVQMG